MTEAVPVGTVFNAAASSPGWLCAGTGAGSSCTLSIPAISACVSTARVFAVTVAAPIPAGLTDVVNTASVADDGARGADPIPDNNQASDSTPITGGFPDLTLTKTDGGATASPGGGIAYTLTVANVGTRGASGVQATETVPQGTTFAGPAGSWSCSVGAPAGTTCTSGLGTLAAGTSASLEGETSYRLRSDQGFMDLVVERLPQCPETGAAIFSLCHYFEQHGDLCQDPEMTVRVFLPGSAGFLGMVPSTDPRLGRLEALSFQQALPPVYHEIYPEPGHFRPRLRRDLNGFLTTWLRNLKDQGHRPVKEEH